MYVFKGTGGIVLSMDGLCRDCPWQLVNSKCDEVGNWLGQFHVNFQHFLFADHYSPFAKRVVVLGQWIAVPIHSYGYGQRAEVWRPGGDRDRSDCC